MIKDTIEGALRWDSSGYEDTRVHIVTGVEGGTPAKRKWDAMHAAGVERRGDKHPVAPGATVRSVTAEPYQGENTVYKVTIEYGGDSDGTQEGLQGSGVKDISVSTSTASAVTTRDISGNLIRVEYRGDADFVFRSNREIFDANQAGPSFTSQVQSAEYEISVLRATITVERTIPSLQDHQRFKMSTNRFPWSGEPPFHWLILGVDSSSNGTGGHDHSYQLAHTEGRVAGDGWRYRAEITTPLVVNVGNTSVPLLPKSPTVGNGIELIHLYRSIDYSQLGFSIPR